MEGAVDVSTTTSASTSYVTSGVTSRQAGSGRESREEDSGLYSPSTSASFTVSLTASAMTVSTERQSPSKSTERNDVMELGSAFTPAINLLDDVTGKEREKKVDKGGEKVGKKLSGGELIEKGEDEGAIERNERAKEGEDARVHVTTAVKAPSQSVLECDGNEREGCHNPVTLEASTSASACASASASACASSDLGPDDEGSLSLSVSVSFPPPRMTETSGKKDIPLLVTSPSPITPETVLS